MFFTASKALAPLIDPRVWAGGLLCLALGWRRRAALAITLGTAAVFLAFGTYSPHVADVVERWVEASARSTFRPGARYDAAIVLGGSEDSRLAAGAQVLQAGSARFLLYSGRLGSDQPRWLDEKFAELGIPPGRVVIEPRSRNTHENAVESARVAAEHGWRSLLIVTSADHAPRALACFRRAGLQPDVLPVDDRPPIAGPRAPAWPSVAALGRMLSAVHELVGRVVYRAAGYAAG